MNLIDYQDSRPIYEQISERYKLLILRGVLQPDEKMPSVRQLAMELSTNPNTIQRAYQELEHQGYLYSVKGMGSFVKPNQNLKSIKIEELKLRIRELLKEASDAGIDPKELLEGVLDD